MAPPLSSHIDRMPLNRNRIAADFWYLQISYRCPMNRYIVSWWNQRFTPLINTKWMLYFPAASDEQLYYSFQGKPRLVVCNQEQVCNALKDCHDNLDCGVFIISMEMCSFDSQFCYTGVATWSRFSAMYKKAFCTMYTIDTCLGCGRIYKNCTPGIHLIQFLIVLVSVWLHTVLMS